MKIDDIQALIFPYRVSREITSEISLALVFNGFKCLPMEIEEFLEMDALYGNNMRHATFKP